MEASVSVGPVRTIPSDAPIFTPLRWGMTRDQARRALTADGWRRVTSSTDSTPEMYEGTMFGREALLGTVRNSAGRLVRSAIFIEDISTFT